MGLPILCSQLLRKIFFAKFSLQNFLCKIFFAASPYYTHFRLSKFFLPTFTFQNGQFIEYSVNTGLRIF